VTLVVLVVIVFFLQMWVVVAQQSIAEQSYISTARARQAFCRTPAAPRWGLAIFQSKQIDTGFVLAYRSF
jgi:hypothetical protein